MKVGTKSLLFGAHQFILHPVTVLLAWRKLYGKFPGWKELTCIVMHDWGYWGCADMDGKEGSLHPEWAAQVVYRWWGSYYYHLCLFHSRHRARWYKSHVSKLYYADKLSFCYVPWWLYVPMGLLSGEIHEYEEQTSRVKVCSKSGGWKQWHQSVCTSMRKLSKDPKSLPYLHKEDD